MLPGPSLLAQYRPPPVVRQTGRAFSKQGEWLAGFGQDEMADCFPDLGTPAAALVQIWARFLWALSSTASGGTFCDAGRADG